MQKRTLLSHQPLSHLTREQFDVLVIGGGITGAGVALDAVARGYKVALVEKNDFASGTSSKSTKLVHGGIRYLPNFDFALVHEALVERGLLLQNAPYLVQPIGFVLPIYEGDRHPVGMPFTTPKGIGLSKLLDIGLWMYDLMAGKRSIRRHRHLNCEETIRKVPALLPTGLKEGFIYYDAQTIDTRLTLAVLRTAAQFGAVITNYTEVTDFTAENGKLTGAIVRDQFSGHELVVKARHIVNATGIYAEKIEEMTGYEPTIHVAPSKGVHLILDREKLQMSDEAIVLPETEDKRILFLVPWQTRVVFGTTDTGSGDLDQPVATQEDIQYLLKYLNRYTTPNFTEDDIISTYVGYRPLVKPRQTNVSTARLSRTHAVLQNPSGLVTIVGGKLTTYRRMAQDTLDLLNKRDGSKPTHPTIALPLQGSAGWSKQKIELERQGSKLDLPINILEHLGQSYGTEAFKILDMIEKDRSLGMLLIDDLPYLRAEVIYSCRYELALTPYDVLARRTAIIIEDRQRGLEVVDEVADLMEREHQWTPEEKQRLIQQYRDAIHMQKRAEQIV